MTQKPSDRTPSTPKYLRKRRQHSRDTAFLELHGKRLPLGFYGTPESRQEYDTVVAERKGNGRQLPAKPNPDGLFVGCLPAWRMPLEGAHVDGVAFYARLQGKVVGQGLRPVAVRADVRNVRRQQGAVAGVAAG